MGTNSRRGNISSTNPRGGVRRSNTPPPPSVRLGIDGLPEKEPISTDRPRGAELPKGIPVLQMPPADVVAAAAASSAAQGQRPARSDVALAKVPPAGAPSAPRAEILAPEPPPEALLTPPGVAPADGGDAESNSPTAPMVNAKSGKGLEGDGGKRKGRGSNKKAISKTAPSTTPAVVASVPAANDVTLEPSASNGSASTAAADGEASTRGEENDEEATGGLEAPASAVPVSDLAERFFDHGERASNAAHEGMHDDGSDIDSIDPRMAHKNSPEARARREKNWRYLMWVGLGCVVLLVAAVVKNGATKSEYTPAPVPVVSMGSVPTAPVDSAATVQLPEPVGAPSGSAALAAAASGSAMAPAGSASGAVVAAASGSASGEPAVAASASSKPGETVAAAGEAMKGPGADPSSPPAPPPAVAEPTEDEKKSALQDKRACESFLNQSAFAKAVEAGERAVALDPSDGETWLMLGAAYQSMGKGQEARRSYSSCVAEGKRGPINDCRAMLR